VSKTELVGIWVLLAIALAVLFGTGREGDPDQMEKCYMVAINEADAARGLPPEKRAGWPRATFDNLSCPQDKQHKE
jgi:hypothetical protein